MSPIAYTTPFTAVAGTAWRAADWNSYGRDNIAWLATDSPACRAYNSATLSLANNTLTALTLNSERYDNAALHSTSTNTSRATVPIGGGGKYVIGATVAWGLNATGYRQLRFRLNGTTDLGIDSRVDATGTTGVESAPFTVYALAAADYVEAMGNQTSGGALNCGGNPGPGPEFYVFWFRN